MTTDGFIQLAYPDGDVYERVVARSRHHEARCRWCDYQTGWLVQTFEAINALDDHLADMH